MSFYLKRISTSGISSSVGVTLVCNTELNFELDIYLLQQQVHVVETH